MNNAQLFKQIFGEYATAIWAMTENEFLEWLNADVPDTNVGDAISRQAAIDAVCSVCGATDCKGFKLKMFCPEPYAIQKLPSAEPEPECMKCVFAPFKQFKESDTHDKRTETHACVCEHTEIHAEPEIILCKDCIHKPLWEDGDIRFPDDDCPCRCPDTYYNWIPEDEWFCGNGKRAEE